MLTASAGRTAAPSGGVKRLPVAALFRGLGSITQQAFCRSVYAHTLLAAIVLSGIGIPSAHGNSPGMRRGSVSRRAILRNDTSQFPGVRVKGYRPPSVPRPQRPILSKFGRLDLSTSAPYASPCLKTPSGLLRFRGGCSILKLSVGHTRACCFFVLWCPTLQNHAVTAYAVLFAGFEKMLISCGFVASAYETICCFMTANLAIQAIKKPGRKIFVS